VKDYVISVILVSAVCAIVSAILPDGRGRLREPLDFVLAIAILTVIILPFGRAGELFDGLSDTLSGIFDSDGVHVEDDGGWLMSKREEALEAALADEVAERFELRREEVTVEGSLSLSEDKIYVESLSVALSGLSATGDYRAIGKYLSEVCGVECEVVLYP